MIIMIDRREAAALTLHMSIMRKSYRNLVKKKYTADKISFLQSYDYLLAEARDALEEERENYELNMNIKDLEILHEFLNAYVEKSQKVNDKVNAQDYQEQLDVLIGLKQKAFDCMSA